MCRARSDPAPLCRACSVPTPPLRPTRCRPAAQVSVHYSRSAERSGESAAPRGAVRKLDTERDGGRQREGGGEGRVTDRGTSSSSGRRLDSDLVPIAKQPRVLKPPRRPPSARPASRPTGRRPRCRENNRLLCAIVPLSISRWRPRNFSGRHYCLSAAASWRRGSAARLGGVAIETARRSA